jgi:hypothetical protein
MGIMLCVLVSCGKLGRGVTVVERVGTVLGTAGDSDLDGAKT